MQVKSNGSTTMAISESDSEGKFNVAYGELQGKYILPVHFYLIGDLKFMFMVVGRDDYSGS